MRVAVRVDASELIGGGHAMRCLTLANALAECGAEVTFVTAAMPEALRQRIAAAEHALVERPALADLDRTGPNWHEPPLGGDVQREDVTATEAAVGRVDWMLVDHYLLDARWHSAARRFAAKILVIDDLANRTYDCDLLVDQTFGLLPSDYDGLVPRTARVLAGATYALLRPEFSRERRAALDRRKEARPVRRILVSMGTTDPGRISARIVEAVLATTPDCTLDVVLGPQAMSSVPQHPNVTIHADSHRMAELMLAADLAIGAAGATSWERCCLGLPSIALVLAENQRAGADALDEAGAAVAIENIDAIPAVLGELLGDRERFARMSAAAFAIVDGLGTQRVLAAMLGSPKQGSTEVTLRPATIEDAEALWLWRNDPIARAQSRNSEPITWSDHTNWLTAALADPSRRTLIAETEGVRVGTIRFDSTGHGACEVSLAVAPDRRGCGIGRAMLRAACAQMGSADIDAAVRADNVPSRKLFESCGFRPIGGAEPGFLRYRLAREQSRRKQA